MNSAEVAARYTFGPLCPYINNNEDKIVDYRARKNAGLVFTSQLAESTVESLINQRCKRQQQMRWSREGLNRILQIRAAIFSDDWNETWGIIVTNALTLPKLEKKEDTYFK